ncbi:hypothetical protein PROFUN_07740 [Planoprotostelium fungivorum]|uniref:Uncharacterized protein n=1 Tax=Planoprotostelium fungivorum TaxID=1890364 RepID=A0A2P6N1F0_9EUKA|nr:hypothetical protein PROFUN_07740 [Planoprotostelium fungivorum]
MNLRNLYKEDEQQTPRGEVSDALLEVRKSIILRASLPATDAGSALQTSEVYLLWNLDQPEVVASAKEGRKVKSLNPVLVFG